METPTNQKLSEIAIVVYPAPAIFILGLKGFFTTVGEPIIDSSGFQRFQVIISHRFLAEIFEFSQNGGASKSSKLDNYIIYIHIRYLI